MTTAQGGPAYTPVIPSWTLADRLRKVRREVARAEQIEFAKMLEVGAPTYAAWESGRTTPRNQVAVAKRVELATGVPAGWMLGLDEPTPPSVPFPGSPQTPGGAASGEGFTHQYVARQQVGVVLRPQFRPSPAAVATSASAAVGEREAS